MAGEINLNQQALQNAFAPTMSRGTKQFATNVPTTPSYNPFGSNPVGYGTPPMVQGTPGYQPLMSGGMRDMAEGAMGGLGTYMVNNAGAKQSALQNNTQLRRDQSALSQRQGENMQSNARDVMGVSPAGYDIEPYANMALRRALIGSYSPQQIQAPEGIQMGKVSGGMDLTALAGPMNQYFSDNAIRSSMQQQQELRNNVDPNTPQATAGMQIYAPGEYDSNMEASNNSQQAAQGRQSFYNDGAQQALLEAIKANNKSSRFNPLEALLGAVVGGGKSFLSGGLL